MKLQHKYILSLLTVLVMSACSKDFLDIAPQDKLTADNFYKSEAEIKSATASLYGFPWFDFNDRFYWLTGDEMAGNLYYTYDQEGQFFYFSFNEGNAYLSSGWKGLYRVVSYANSIINDMPPAAEGKVGQDVINRALGEARFMRGTAYYLLAEYWGEVPIVENSTELVANNDLLLPKNTKANAYEFARRDLAFAADNLPDIDPQPGRLNKWSAKAMLAKLHLTMAQNLSDANSAENFSKAKQLAEDVITNSGHSLMSNYADLFKIENNNNSESLFSLQWMEGAYAVGNSRQANWARSSRITGNSECWGGGKSATLDLVQQIEPNDKRQPSIFMASGNYYPEINKAGGGYTYNIVAKDPNDANVVIEGAAPVLNNIKKYIVGSADDTGGKVSTGQATAINQVMLRLADVYLIYAEAELGAAASTSDAKALGYFNTIRTRAGLPAKTSISFDDILKERRVEFCFESNFWFDIKRFYYRDPSAALAYMNAQKRDYTYYRKTTPNAPDENSIDGYELQPPAGPITISASQMVMPIPAAEVVANSKLAPGVAPEEYKFR